MMVSGTSNANNRWDFNQGITSSGDITAANISGSTSGNNNPIDTIGNSWSSRFNGDIASIHFYQGKSLTSDRSTTKL